MESRPELTTVPSFSVFSTYLLTAEKSRVGGGGGVGGHNNWFYNQSIS